MLALASLLAALACSEKPRVAYIWELTPADQLPRRAALHGVAAHSMDVVVAVGALLPERVVRFRPVAIVKTPQGWVEEDVPLRVGESMMLMAAAAAEDGSVWACGHSTLNEDDPTTTTPLLYRRTNGVWEAIDLGMLDGLAGTSLMALACAGRGDAFELRAVGTRLGEEAVCLEVRDGRLSWLPVPPRLEGARYGLAAVGCSPWGDWYAAGNSDGGLGGAVYVDRGDGWRSIPGPQHAGLEFVSLAFDAAGDAWFAANDASLDVPEGALYAYRSGGFEEIPIKRLTAGPARLYALGFDPQGYGWVAGGRPPDDPFFAGNSGGSSWSEVIVDADYLLEQGGGEGGEGSEGGEVMALRVLGSDAAIAVGRVEETGLEGYLEQFPRVFQYQPIPAGDPDLPAAP